MKERPILFNGPMVRAILEGRKTQTRRVIKSRYKDSFGWGTAKPLILGSQEDFDARYRCPYGKPGDRLMCYLCAHEHYITSRTAPDTSVAEQRLHGRVGREHLQPDEVRGIRQERIDGLVSIDGPHQQQGISNDKSLSREQESDKVGPSVSVHGLSRNAEERTGDAPLERKQGGQQAGESMLGNSSGELARQADSRNGPDGGESSCVEVYGHGSRAYSMGPKSWSLQSEAGGACSRCNAVVDKRYRVGGDLLWVREEHYRYGHWEEVPGVRTKGGRQKWKFVADTDEVVYEPPVSFRKGRHHKDSHTTAWHKRLARFMPRWASRITLEVVSVRVERLNDCSREDAIAEGIDIDPELPADPRDTYRSLWESINGPGSWDANPWVWVVGFKAL